MDHMLGRQPITFGDLGIACLATIEQAAFFEQLITSRVVDRSVHATTAEQCRVGGVDDGVNAQGCNVGDGDFEPGVADQPPCQVQAAVVAGTPLSANSCCSSPAWNISRMMSQPPTNSPFT